MNIASLLWNIFVQSYLKENFNLGCKNWATYQGQQGHKSTNKQHSFFLSINVGRGQLNLYIRFAIFFLI